MSEKNYQRPVPRHASLETTSRANIDPPQSGLSSSLADALRRFGDDDSAAEVDLILKARKLRPTLAQRLMPRG